MKRSTLLLLALLVLLAIAAWLVLQRPGESSIGVGDGAVLAEADSAAVDRITVTGAQGTVVLEKQGGQWTLTEPLVYPADAGAVTTALGKVLRAPLGSVVSANPAKQNVFQVDSAATLVRLFAQGVEVTAFRVGKPGPSWTDTYVRREGSDEVHLAGELLTPLFTRAVKEWRDKTVFSADPSAVRDVEFRYGDTTFTLALADSVWLLDGAPVAPTVVRPFLTALGSLQADDFVDSAVTAPPPIAAVVSAGGTQIRFHHAKDAPAYFVQTSASPRWYSLQQWRVQQVLKRRADFSPPG